MRSLMMGVEMGRPRLDAVVGRAEGAALTRVGDDPLVAARLALNAEEAMAEIPLDDDLGLDAEDGLPADRAGGVDLDHGLGRRRRAGRLPRAVLVRAQALLRPRPRRLAGAGPGHERTTAWGERWLRV
jgi:hypothetical protein